jgi:GNAT superfamily N-acetyltransferase
MTSDVQIAQFTVADRDALLSFLRIAYPDDPRKSEPASWDWHYLQNPYTARDDIPLWIVKDGTEVVGQAATIPVNIKVGNEVARAIWILDFILLPEYRGQKLGKRLLLKARESVPMMVALGFNEQSGAVLRSLDWVALGGVHRYHRLLYPGDAFGELARLGPLRTLANVSYAPFRPRSSETSGSHGLRQISEFDSSFDDLWQRASSQWPCAVVRNSAYLDWQFLRQPRKKFDILGIYERDRLMGYVVMFFRKPGSGQASPKAAITDICYDAAGPANVIDQLLNGALHLALTRRAGSLVTDVLDEPVEARLQQLGFWRIKSAPQFMVYTPTNQDLIYNARNWFLTRADSDVSIFEAPNL